MSKLRDPDTGRPFTDDEVAWIASHTDELRRVVSEHRVRYPLWIGLGLGLAVHIVGFYLKSSAAGDLMALLADLLYALGFALWTGVVVVAMVEIVPAAKERQITKVLEAYQATVGSEGPRRNEPPRPLDPPDADR
jgi:hypothetical protein